MLNISMCDEFLSVMNVMKCDELVIEDYLGCSVHSIVKFTLLRSIRQTKNKIEILNFRKGNFHLFRDLVKKKKKQPWEFILKDKGAEQ